MCLKLATWSVSGRRAGLGQHAHSVRVCALVELRSNAMITAGLAVCRHLVSIWCVFDGDAGRSTLSRLGCIQMYVAPCADTPAQVAFENGASYGAWALL